MLLKDSLNVVLTKSNNRRLRRLERKRQSRINAGLKRRLFEELAFAPCCYCTKAFLVEYLTIEHIMPRSLGGTNDSENIALACAPCNQERGREAWFIKKELMKKLWQNS